MRILVFHQFYTRLSEAGISRFNVFAEEWKKQGVHTEVITGSVNYVTGDRKPTGWFRLFAKEFDESGVYIVRTWSSSFALGYRSFLGRLASYGTFLFSAFWAGMFAERPQVIIASSPPLFIGLLAWIVAAFRGIPFVFEVRDLWPDEVIELGYVKNKIIISMSYALERFMYNRARRIVVNSPGLAQFLYTEKEIRVEKIAVVPNSVSIVPHSASQIESFRTRMGWEGKCVVLYSGSHSFVYDFDTLLDSAKYFLNRPELLFVLVGDGRQKPHVVFRADQERITNVKTLAPISKKEVALMQQSADICVATLKDMRLLACVYATKVFDYMAAGKPAVVLMRGVTAELVHAAGCGAALLPGDAEGFARAIDQLSRDPLLRTRMGEAGRRFLSTHFDKRELARIYLECLQSVVQKRSV